MVTIERPSQAHHEPISSALDGRPWGAASIVSELAGRAHDVRPFAPPTLDLCGELSRRLMQLREHPEAVSLGFWMRPASLVAMRDAFAASSPADQLSVPRGLAFHVTPANVDTLFLYSWALSLLVGNANIVRLSSRASTVRSRILAELATVLAEPAFAEQAARNHFILTDHDEATLASLSRVADVRVVWGGDATVEHFRRFPLPIHGREVVFPDRHSMAILDAAGVAALDDGSLTALADRFFVDSFWFDQGACSSPRLVIWRSDSDEARTELAVRRFHDAVMVAVRRRGYVAETGMALNKMAFATDVAARHEGVRIESEANEAHWVRLATIADYERENCGGGLFFEVISDDLEADVVSLVGRRDQTVVTFGLGREHLLALAQRLNGRGVDRFVPIGQALAFDATWDGLDLLHELSRRVVVDAGRPS